MPLPNKVTLSQGKGTEHIDQFLVAHMVGELETSYMYVMRSYNKSFKYYLMLRLLLDSLYFLYVNDDKYDFALTRRTTII